MNNKLLGLDQEWIAWSLGNSDKPRRPVLGRFPVLGTGFNTSVGILLPSLEPNIECLKIIVPAGNGQLGIRQVIEGQACTLEVADATNLLHTHDHALALLNHVIRSKKGPES